MRDVTDDSRVVRPRDARRTRAELLEAAADLFGQHGYAATTLRAIGDRAGADPALVARYFGSKEALYLEAITHSSLADSPDEPLSREALARMMERAAESGPTPVARIALVGTDDSEIRARVNQFLHDRTLVRLGARLKGTEPRDDGEAALRAEIALAMALGVAAARSSGVLENLAAARTDDVVELCLGAIEALLDP